MKGWKVKSSKYVIDNPWIKVRRDDIQIKDKILDYYIVEERDGVVVVALTDKTEVVMINQYKIGVAQQFVVLPSGYIDDKHKSPEHAAKQELSEEAGYEAAEFEKIGSFYRSPGRHTQKVNVFLARDLSSTKRELEIDEEEIKIEIIKLSKVLEMIKTGKIKDMETIASILMVNEYLNV